jgi:uncharacterized protein with HEPN domain
MRPEKLYLQDIVESAEAIQPFCEPVDEEQFLHDELRQSAVLHKLIVISEAAAPLPGELRQRHAEIVWEDIVGFRNIAVHEYFAVLWQIVWNTAIYDVPELRKEILKILANEYQGD